MVRIKNSGGNKDKRGIIDFSGMEFKKNRKQQKKQKTGNRQKSSSGVARNLRNMFTSFLG